MADEPQYHAAHSLPTHPGELKTVPTDAVLVVTVDQGPTSAGWRVAGIVRHATSLEQAEEVALGADGSLAGQPVLATRIGGNQSERRLARRTQGPAPPPEVELAELPDPPEPAPAARAAPPGATAAAERGPGPLD